MESIKCENVKEFVDTLTELYGIFFKRYPALKFIAVKPMLYSSGNFGLILMDKGRISGKFTIFNTPEGSVIECALNDKLSVLFKLDLKIYYEILKNKNNYKAKPAKLFKFIPTFLNAMLIQNTELFGKSLKGEKTILRPGTESDLPYLVNWYNDYELNRLAGWSDKKATMGKLRYNMNKSFGYDPMNLIIDNLNGVPIGTIQLYDFSEQDRSCKLGIRIGDKDYWSKGYGRDSILTLLDYAFMSQDIYRVSLKVYEYNDRALSCYLRCGFRYEGKTRKSAYIDGHYYDEIIMGILKSDYLQL